MGRIQKTLKEVIAERRKWYYSVSTVYCKYFKEQVKFNKYGFQHTLRDGRGHYRGHKDAMMRLHLLPWAPVVIKNAINMPDSEIRAANDPRNRLGKEVTFFELQAVVKVNSKKHLDITVVLRRIGNGDLHYYSIRYTRHGYKDSDN